MRRHVTTVAIFLDDNKTNDDGDGKENGTHFRHPTDEQFGHLDIFFSNYYNLQSVYFELNWMFILTSNNFARESRYFIHFFTIVAPLRLRPLYVVHVGEHNTNLDNDRYGPRENFAKICQFKWNWIRSVKFEIMRIDYQKFCYHGNVTWGLLLSIFAKWTWFSQAEGLQKKAKNHATRWPKIPIKIFSTYPRALSSIWKLSREPFSTEMKF